MIVAKIHVDGVCATAEYRKRIPAGIIGAQVQFDYAADPWEGLHKTVVFQGAVTKDVITNDSLITVPAEVVSKPNVVLRVGVYGVDADGSLAIPTLWADLGTIRDATDPSGDTTTDPSMPVWAQILAMIGNLEDLDTTAKNNLVAAVNEALTKGGGTVDPAEIQRIVDAYLAANPPKVTETDPTVPAWAKQPQKPTYTAKEVGALPDTYTPPNQTAQQVGADPAGTAATAVSQHNTDTAAHNDLRIALQGLSDRVNAALDSDDTTLDQMSEVVAYIKSNKSLIDAITTSKVSVSDIINDLVTNVADKPLSAAQGVALKGLIDEFRTLIPEGGSGISVTGATVGQTIRVAAVDDDGNPTAWEPVDLPSGGAYTYKHIETITIPDGEEISAVSITIPAKTRKVYVFAFTNTTNNFNTSVRPSIKNGNVMLAAYNINLVMDHRKALFSAELYEYFQFMRFASSNSTLSSSCPGYDTHCDYASYFHASDNTFNIVIQSASPNQYFAAGCTFELYALCEE